MISTYCVMCVYIQEAEKFSRVLLLKVILICDVTQQFVYLFQFCSKTANLILKPIHFVNSVCRIFIFLKRDPSQQTFQT